MPIYARRFSTWPQPGAVFVHLGYGDVGVGGRCEALAPEDRPSGERRGEIMFSRLGNRYEAGTELPNDPEQEKPVRIIFDSIAALDVLVSQLKTVRDAMEHGPAEMLWIAEAP